MPTGLIICLGLLGLYGVMAALLVVRIVHNFLENRRKVRIARYKSRRAKVLNWGV